MVEEYDVGIYKRRHRYEGHGDSSGDWISWATRLCARHDEALIGGHHGSLAPFLADYYR